MADCTKSSKRIAEDAVEMEQEEEQGASSPSLLSKRTKLTSQESKELENLPPIPATLLPNDHVSVDALAKTPSSSDSLSPSDDFSSSRCLSNDSRVILNSADPQEATSFETEVSTCNNNKFRFSISDSSSLSEICCDSDQTTMDSPTKKPPPETSRRKPSAEKMPSVAEMEEFFWQAEKYEQKRFAEKYNYDVVKDEPLEGRFQWVRLK